MTQGLQQRRIDRRARRAGGGCRGTRIRPTTLSPTPVSRPSSPRITLGDTCTTDHLAVVHEPGRVRNANESARDGDAV